MKELHILNLGAGVQSTALYLMSLRRDEPDLIPVFDYAIFADTQEEPKAVYDHLAWLKSLGGPPILEGTAGKLGDDIVHGYSRSRPGKTAVGFKQIPAFQSSVPGVLEGKASRHCTAHYKIGVVDRVIRQQVLGLNRGERFPSDVLVHQYFGLSHDEPKRIVKVQDRFAGSTNSAAHFPLWDLRWDRADCRSYLEEVEPSRRVPRSACTFCPFHSNAEWRRVRDGDPEGWARSVEIDRALRNGAACAVGLDTSLYLHRSCLPLDQAPIDEPESGYDQHVFGFAAECEGMCGV